MRIRESTSVSWVHSSVVERLTADQQVFGSNPGVPFCKNSLIIVNIVFFFYFKPYFGEVLKKAT